MRRFAQVFFVSVAVLVTGCRVSIPRPTFHQVDQEAPAFKEAVALEKKRQEEKGRSPAKAEARAVRTVTREIIQTEAQRQAEKAVPLAEALRAFERPRGCWAYTFTTTTHHEGKTTVEVARFDAFQPEERLWTLVSRDGEVPDEKVQANYRRAMLKNWKKSMSRATRRNDRKNTMEQTMWNACSMSDLVVADPDATGQTTFTFTSITGHFPMIGDIPAMRTTYTTDANRNVLRQTDTFLTPASIMGGTIKVLISDVSSDYVLIEPEAPPFLSRIKVHQHIHVFGKDYGERKMEIVYADYRRVKCYDDRFEVKMGAPDMMDFMPGKD